jgi:Concanavalin A-like lectin/glucanases superfamily
MKIQLALLPLVAIFAAAPAFGATLVASYNFNNTFAADQAGDPALSPVDPTGTSVFQTDTVLGQSRTVWAFNGNGDPTTGQSGLTLNTAGLVNPEDYSVDFIAEFSQRSGGYRRLLDVQNRQSDNGFYVNPTNNLEVFPINGSSAGWTNNVYHHVVLTDDGTTVNAYLDGVSQFSATTTELNLDFDPTDNPNKLLGFFLDNKINGGQGEWSPGSIALVQLWDGVLTPTEAQTLANNPFANSAPEPASLTLLALVSPLLLRRRSKI